MSMHKISGLDDVLEKLSAKEKAAEDDMGGKDTSHPSADVDNSTKDNSLEGARSSENLADNKDEQPIGVEDAGSPEVKEPAGSQGVEDKEPEDKGDMEGDDKSGVSEQLDKDTSHASATGEKRGGDSTIDKLIGAVDELMKSASEDEPEKKDESEPKEAGETEDPPKAGDGEDKTAAEEQEKLAAHIEKVAEEHPDHVKAGFEFGQYTMEYLKTAAAVAQNGQKMHEMLKKAGIEEEAAAGLAPDLGMEEGAGGDQVLEAVAQQLAAEGVEPEELAQLLQGEMGEAGGEMGGMPGGEEMGGLPEGAMPGGEEMPGGGEMGGEADPMAGMGDEDQVAALEAALGETGTSPEELAAAAAGEGGETAQEEAKVGGVKLSELKPGTEKFASIIADNPEKATKLAALKDSVVADLTNLKAAKAK